MKSRIVENRNHKSCLGRFVWPTIALMEQLFDTFDRCWEKNGWIRNGSRSHLILTGRALPFLDKRIQYKHRLCSIFMTCKFGSRCAPSAHHHRIFIFNWNSVAGTIVVNRMWSKMSICVDLFINNSMSCCPAPLSFAHRTFIDRQLVASQLIAARSGAARWHLTRVNLLCIFQRLSRATNRFYRRFSTIEQFDRFRTVSTYRK